jgi:aromatic-amino-acid transaminase
MNAPAPPSLLSAVELAPRDPILGVTEAFNADTNPDKVNLGVGVYCDENGKVPLLECVKRAERELADQAAPRSYLPIDGIPAYDREVRALLFGRDSEIVTSGRAIASRRWAAPGALKVGADFLRRFAPGAQVWISDPSWENHRALFEGAGFGRQYVRLLRRGERGFDFAGMVSRWRKSPGSVVVLHACCHNPTWRRSDTGPLAAHHRNRAAARSGAVSRPCLPGIRRRHRRRRRGRSRIRGTPGPMLVSSSFSKSFSIYGERVGALSIVAADKDEAARVLSQVKRIIRANYSNPPTHGGQVVATVLCSPELRALWEAELAAMRDRIKLMRALLVERLHEAVRGADFRFILNQRGMFSYSGLTKPQVLALREQFSIYAIDTGRICVAALNTQAIVRGVAAALRKSVR